MSADDSPLSPGLGVRARLCVCDLFALYVRHSERSGRHCPQALLERKRTLQKFAMLYGPVEVIQLRPFYLTDFVDAQPGWKSDHTRRDKAEQIKSAFQWAVDQGRIHRNPFKTIKLPEGERRPEVPDDVFTRLCAAVSRALERALRFLRLVGCRVGELCRAEWPHMDLDRGVWTVWIHKTVRRTKKPKYKALVPEAVDLLKVIRSLRPKGCPYPHVFLNAHGRPQKPKSMSAALIVAKKRLGIDPKITIHGIRHRFASAWVANRGSLKLLAEQLGHSTTKTAEKFYVDLSGEMDAIREEARLAVPRMLRGD